MLRLSINSIRRQQQCLIFRGTCVTNHNTKHSFQQDKYPVFDNYQNFFVDGGCTQTKFSFRTTNQNNAKRQFSSQQYTRGVKPYDAKVDYYKVLGIKKNASQQQIRQKYYEMAKKYHPDLNTPQGEQDDESAYEEANKKFQEINSAYQILSDEKLKLDYDIEAGFVKGPSSDQDNDEQSIYDIVFKNANEKQRKQEQKEAEKQKPLDLDAELKKLEKIKNLRLQKQNEYYERKNKTKLEHFTKLYFEQEMQNMGQQGSSGQSSKKKIFRKSEDFREKREVPDHRRRDVNQNQSDHFQETANEQDFEESQQIRGKGFQKLETKEVMFEPNQLDYFYAHEETSERIFGIDNFMNKVFQMLSLIIGSAVSIAAVWHFKQKYDLDQAALRVTQRRTILKDEVRIDDTNQSVQIIANGKLQLELTENKAKTQKNLNADDAQQTNAGSVASDSNKERWRNPNLEEDLRKVLLYMKRHKPMEPYQHYKYYKENLKPEIQESNPRLYQIIQANDTQLRYRPFGVDLRFNDSGQKQIMRDPDVPLSIFDDDAFLFYLIKYCEHLGTQSLIKHVSRDSTLTYNDKRLVVEYIIKTEKELGVTITSWKHCLLYLLIKGSITEEQFRTLFKFSD